MKRKFNFIADNKKALYFKCMNTCTAEFCIHYNIHSEDQHNSDHSCTSEKCKESNVLFKERNSLGELTR